MDSLVAAGLGLDYTAIRLERTTAAWLAAGADLRDRVARTLDGIVAGVETVGSSSVPGLLAKPVIDLAVGLTAEQALPPVMAGLEAAGWIYRGDAGSDGGHVFVLETRPWHRVAHLHAVGFGGSQWRNYLQFRDLLRRSADARKRYETVKLRLAAQEHGSRTTYTEGKTQVVTRLLAELPHTDCG